MRRQTPYVCLCLLVLLAACVGARFTYQDLSVPEDEIQGFSITQTFGDDDSWVDVTQTEDGFEVGTFSSSRSADNDYSVSRLVDSVYDALFSPHVRTMEYMMPTQTLPSRQSASQPPREPEVPWSINSYYTEVQVLDSVSSSDLFRQLSLARFAPQRYRVYVVPVAEEPFDDEPSMEQLLRELDEETRFLSSQMDDATVVTYNPADDSVTATFLPAAVTSTYDSMAIDPMPLHDTPDTQMSDVSALYTYSEDYGDNGYFDSYDLALDPYEVYDDSVPPMVQSLDDPFTDMAYTTSYQLSASPYKSYEPFDELPRGWPARTTDDSLYDSYCSGWHLRLPHGVSVWTAVLCVACVAMWVYVFVEYRMNGLQPRSAFARSSSDDDSDALDSPSDNTKAPLLPLKGEFDGVEAADVYRAYCTQYWHKVQHARDHAAPANVDYTLKAFAQP